MVTNTMWAYAEVKHSVRRAVTSVWYHVLLLLVVSLIAPMSREFIYLCGAVVAFRWLVVFHAFLQFRALREAVYRSAHIGHTVKLGSVRFVSVNGVWFKFSKVKSDKVSRLTYDLFERTYTEGGV